jgi:hypothetical protein
MAVTFAPKPRLRLPSGDFPEPKIVCSKSWLPYAIVVWLVVVVASHGILYGWLPLTNQSTSIATTLPAHPPVLDSVGDGPPATSRIGVTTSGGSVATISPARAIRPTSVDPNLLPSCEAVVDPDANPTESIEPLPVNLSRSPIGSLLDTHAWTKPCRGPGHIRVNLCVAIKAGQLVGASVTTEPRVASTERCIVRAVASVPYEPEVALRKAHIMFELLSDRGK